jgi:hypothetical protein
VLGVAEIRTTAVLFGGDDGAIGLGPDTLQITVGLGLRL